MLEICFSLYVNDDDFPVFELYLLQKDQILIKTAISVSPEKIKHVIFEISI